MLNLAASVVLLMSDINDNAGDGNFSQVGHCVLKGSAILLFTGGRSLRKCGCSLIPAIIRSPGVEPRSAVHRGFYEVAVMGGALDLVIFGLVGQRGL